MAGPVYVKKRLYNPELIVDPDGVLPLGLKNSRLHGHNPVYYIKWVGTTQVAAEELGSAKTANKDGTTTPYLVNVVSSDALDDYDNAAGCVRAVAVIGPSVSSVANYTKGEVPLATVEVIRTNGTADVNSTRYFLWTDHVYACLWGTNASRNAEGNIDIEAPSGTVQMRITAGQNEGEGGTWHFPPNRRLYTQSVLFVPTATLAAGDGVVLAAAHTGFDQALNTEPDLEIDYYTMIHYGAVGGLVAVGQSGPIGRYTTVNSACTWSEIYIANAIVFSLETVQYLDRGE